MEIQNRFLTGAVGPLIFFERNGKQLARTRPRKVKVAAVTLARAANFGQASKLSSVFITEFKRLLSLPKLPALQQRLAGCISKWLAVVPLTEISATPAIPAVKQFRLNTKAELDDLLKQQLRVAGNTGENLQLAISSFQPANNIVTPPWTSQVCFTIAAASCKLSNAALTQVGQANFNIPFTSDYLPAQQIDLKVKLIPGEMTIIVASLLFKGKTYQTMAGVEEMRWRPIEVIGAVYV